MSLEERINVERQSRTIPDTHQTAVTMSLEERINVERQSFPSPSRAAPLTRAVLSINTAQLASIGPILDAIGAATAYRERRVNQIV
jgi:hypothetical protein